MYLIHIVFAAAVPVILATALCAVIRAGEFGEKISSPANISNLPTSTDLRPLFEKFDLPSRRQGPRGTCSVFTVVGGLEYAMAVRDGHGTRLSVEFLNWASHKAAGRTADGGFFSELWTGYEKSGICTEKELAYLHEYNADLKTPPAAIQNALEMRSDMLSLTWIKEWNPHTGVNEDQMARIKSTIASGWPVLGGFRWPNKARWHGSKLQMCSPDEVFDGHSVLLIGFNNDPAEPGGGMFLIRNSGADGTDGYLPFAYVSEYMNDAAWIGCDGKTPPIIPKR